MQLEDLLTHFSRVDDDIHITGANLHIVNGMGDTETTNSLGNLIIGYNELRGQVPRLLQVSTNGDNSREESLGTSSDCSGRHPRPTYGTCSVATAAFFALA